MCFSYISLNGLKRAYIVILPNGLGCISNKMILMHRIHIESRSIIPTEVLSSVGIIFLYFNVKFYYLYLT